MDHPPGAECRAGLRFYSRTPCIWLEPFQQLILQGPSIGANPHCSRPRPSCQSPFTVEARWLQVTLQDQVGIAGEDSEAITTFLESRVERMIQKARSRAVGGRPAILPLIRLRVSPLAYPWIQ